MGLFGGLALGSALGIVSAVPFRLWGPLLGGIVLGFALVGALDDARGLSPRTRLAVEALLALAVMAGWWSFFGWSGSATPAFDGVWAFGILMAALAVAGANAFNMIDNADGLAAGTGAISLLAAALCPSQGGGIGTNPMSAVALAAAGALVGFLFWNRPPARIYLGDAGSLPIGAVLALTLGFALLQSLGVAGVLAVCLVAGYLLFDPLYAVWGRLAGAAAPWRGGTDHPSHDLSRLFGQWDRAYGIILSVQAFSAASGLGVLAGLLPPFAAAVALLPWAALLAAAIRGRAVDPPRGV